MSEKWFFAHGGDRIGPYTAQEMRVRALSGEIQPTDTVWKEGIEKGVLATKVKHLFDNSPPIASHVEVGDLAPANIPDHLSSPPEGSSLSPLQETDTNDAVDEPQVEPTLVGGTETRESTNVEAIQQKPILSPPAPKKERLKRAVPIRGVSIVSQDGKTVKFRKKCIDCGHQDSSWSNMIIRTGSMRVAYFCPKCKKRREVEMLGC